jgi:hypothetical protein
METLKLIYNRKVYPAASTTISSADDTMKFSDAIPNSGDLPTSFSCACYKRLP